MPLEKISTEESAQIEHARLSKLIETELTKEKFLEWFKTLPNEQVIYVASGRPYVYPCLLVQYLQTKGVTNIRLINFSFITLDIDGWGKQCPIPSWANTFITELVSFIRRLDEVIGVDMEMNPYAGAEVEKIRTFLVINPLTNF